MTNRLLSNFDYDFSIFSKKGLIYFEAYFNGTSVFPETNSCSFWNQFSTTLLMTASLRNVTYLEVATVEILEGSAPSIYYVWNTTCESAQGAHSIVSSIKSNILQQSNASMSFTCASANWSFGSCLSSESIWMNVVSASNSAMFSPCSERCSASRVMLEQTPVLATAKIIIAVFDDSHNAPAILSLDFTPRSRSFFFA